eukprot:1229436-Rhodomonas_salina.1
MLLNLYLNNSWPAAKTRQPRSSEVGGRRSAQQHQHPQCMAQEGGQKGAGRERRGWGVEDVCRQRQRQRDRERQRDRDRETERDRERETERQRDRETEQDRQTRGSAWWELTRRGPAQENEMKKTADLDGCPPLAPSPTPSPCVFDLTLCVVCMSCM